jgi:hypothetical protein
MATSIQMLRIRHLALLGILALVLVPAAAHATTIGDVASALRQDPVYNEAGASRALSADDVAELRQRIRDAGTPIFVAILPETAAEHNGGVDNLLHTIAEQTGLSGAYAVVTDREFRTGGLRENNGADEAGTLAFQAHKAEGTKAVLDDWVDRVANLHSTSVGSGGGSGRGGGVFGVGWFWTLILGAIVVIGIRSTIVGSRRRRQAATELAEVSDVAREDLYRLRSDIIELDSIYQPGRDKDTDDSYLVATKELERAERRLDKARSVRDLGVVSRAVEEGRWHLACARARIEGKDLPARSAPCFFNPQHGPSTASVWWTPPDGGDARDVPACDVCAHQLAEGREPDARQITVGDSRVPHWQAPTYYAPWMGGYYGWPGSGFGLGSMFTGFVIGDVVGSAFGGHPDGSGAVVGSDGGWIGGSGGDWGGGGSSGDSGGWFGGGGGDWGGGGGGDFGGGGGDSGGGGGDSGGGSW